MAGAAQSRPIDRGGLFIERRKRPYYTDQELIQALRFVRALGLLAAIEMLVLSGNQEMARALKERAETLGKVLVDC